MWPKSPYVYFKQVDFWHFCMHILHEIIVLSTWMIRRKMHFKKISYSVIFATTLYKSMLFIWFLELRFYECCHSCFIKNYWKVKWTIANVIFSSLRFFSRIVNARILIPCPCHPYDKSLLLFLRKKSFSNILCTLYFTDGVWNRKYFLFNLQKDL